MRPARVGTTKYNDTPPEIFTVNYVWAITHRAWNHLIHALHGNTTTPNLATEGMPTSPNTPDADAPRTGGPAKEAPPAKPPPPSSGDPPKKKGPPKGTPRKKPAFPAMCPENHTPVRFIGNSNNNRYIYRCAQAECQTNVQRAFGYFAQERPTTVTSLSDRCAAWHDTKVTRAMARDENAASRTTTTINPAPQATPHAGDICIGFHNKTGGHGNDPVARKSQMDQMMARAQIWAVCEINTNQTTAIRFATENSDPQVNPVWHIYRYPSERVIRMVATVIRIWYGSGMHTKYHLGQNGPK